jgi:hypothetical protein
MIKNMSIKGFVMVLVVFFASGVYAQKRSDRIPWKITVVVMDGMNQREKAEIPVTEAVEFIEAHSRLDIEVQYVSAPGRHGYTPYKIPNDKPKKGTYTAYAMMGWNVPQSVINSLPVSTSYLFLYKLNSRRPAQAGSALPLTYGLMKGGKPRPYATVPTDLWWYVNTPKDGFQHWAAQILTHELNNSIQAKIEAAPYRCGQLLATQGRQGDLYEGERLSKISDACYAKLLRIP